MNQQDIQNIWDQFQKEGPAYNNQTYGEGPSYVQAGLKLGNPWLAAISQDYMTNFGRLPTPTEAQSVMAAYKTGPTEGASYVAQLKQAEDQAPDKLAKKQQDEYLAEAPQHYGAVGSQFQSLLGRAPTDEEQKHFGSLLASGSVDAYTLGEWLKQQPEYQTTQDTKMRSDLTGELQGQNERYFSEKIMPSIQSALLKSGRSTDSSGYAAMLAKAAQDQNLQRESFLTNLTATQYMGNKAAASGDYQNQMANWYANQNYNTNRSASLADRSYARNIELQNYNIQRDQYEKYLKSYGKRGTNWGAVGSLGGTVLGGIFGGTGGALLGGQLGGSIGSLAGGGY